MVEQKDIARGAMAVTALFSWIEVLSTLLLNSKSNEDLFANLDPNHASFRVLSRAVATVQICTGTMRTMGAINFDNRIAYLTASSTYPLMFLYFFMEATVYGSTTLNFSVIMVLLIAGAMTALLGLSYQKVFPEAGKDQ